MSIELEKLPPKQLLFTKGVRRVEAFIVGDVERHLEQAHKQLGRMGIMRVMDKTAYGLRRAPRALVNKRWLTGFELGTTLTMTALHLHAFATANDKGSSVMRYMRMPTGFNVAKPWDRQSQVMELAAKSLSDREDECVLLSGCLLDEYGYAYHVGIETGIGYALNRFDVAWTVARDMEIARLSGLVHVPESPAMLT